MTHWKVDRVNNLNIHSYKLINLIKLTFFGSFMGVFGKHISSFFGTDDSFSFFSSNSLTIDGTVLTELTITVLGVEWEVTVLITLVKDSFSRFSEVFTITRPSADLTTVTFCGVELLTGPPADLATWMIFFWLKKIKEKS